MLAAFNPPRIVVLVELIHEGACMPPKLNEDEIKAAAEDVQKRDARRGKGPLGACYTRHTPVSEEICNDGLTEDECGRLAEKRASVTWRWIQGGRCGEADG